MNGPGWKWIPLGMLASALLGCAPGQVDGTVQGEAFGRVESALFMRATGTLDELLIVLTNYEDACATYEAYFLQQGEPTQALPLNAVFIRTVLLGTIAADEYPVVATADTYDDGISWTHALYQQYGDDGWTGPTAVSGQLSLDVLEGESAEGSATLTLDSGDTLTVSFEAVSCPLDDF